MICPCCQRIEQQVKIGRNRSGSQRYLCNVCRRKYTPHPKKQGYAEAVRKQAIQHYAEGMNFRCIAREMGIHRQTIATWINTYIDSLPD